MYSKGFMKMNIYLIGYRCTGKTSVSKVLARHLGWAVIDSDAEIVKAQGESISDIVSNKGWDAFRSMEKAVIAQLSGLKNRVIATGGGAILKEENIANMKKSGKVVWLKARPGTIQKRMAGDLNTTDFRPALTDKGIFDEIEETLSIRNPLYETAMDFFIDTDELSIDSVCRKIIDQTREP